MTSAGAVCDHARVRPTYFGVFLLFVSGALGCGDTASTTTSECPDVCTDGNPCTLDSCVDGACVFDPAGEGFSCDDDDACNGEAACDANAVCAPGEYVVTNDGDSCTKDTCDPLTGDVAHEPLGQCVQWTPTSTVGGPTARAKHTAVWTGSRMIIWGGLSAEMAGVTATGALYDPTTDTWTPTSMVNAPSPRHSHAAAWIGTRMLVWGGHSETAFTNSGALYDPTTDTWTPMTQAGAPAGRTSFASTWTGNRFVVFGGLGPDVLGSGAAYNPANDTWMTLVGGPSARFAIPASALGDGRVVVWGGNNLFDWLATGATLDGTNTWTPTTQTGAPTARQEHTAISTGTEIILWGGWDGGLFQGDGAIFDLAGGASGAWTPLATTDAPTARAEHVALWTGGQMFVWGGCGSDSCGDTRADGALWTKSSGTWSPIFLDGAMAARRGATGVWTGDRAIVWGGRNDADAYIATGGVAQL